jgi:hypothetical protein
MKDKTQVCLWIGYVGHFVRLAVIFQDFRRKQDKKTIQTQEDPDWGVGQDALVKERTTD